MDSDFCEPPVKKGRLDEDLEMVNYEIQIDVPLAADAEIDPLLPVDTDQERFDCVQPSGFLEFVQPIKSAPEIMEESPDKTEEIESDFPEIDSVIPNFVLSSHQISESVVIENLELLARSDDGDLTPDMNQEIYISSDEEIEEIPNEPNTQEISREVSDTVGSDFQQVVGAGGPEMKHLNQFQQAPEKQQSSIPETQHTSPSLDQLHVPDPAMTGVSTLSNASQHVTHSNAWNGQKIRSMSDSANLSSSVSINRQANSVPNELALVDVSEWPGAQQTSTSVLNSLIQNQSSSVAMPAVLSSHQDPPRNWLPISMPVKWLLKTPFSSDAWTNEQRKAIIKSSRPKPAIILPPIALPGISSELLYNHIPWLCGSSLFRKFFCWPCLLFSYHSTSVELWSVKATQVLKEGFNQLWKAHEVTHAHQAAEKTHKFWLQSMNDPPLPNSNNESGMRNYTPDSVYLSSVSINRQTNSILNSPPLVGALEHAGALQTATNVLNSLAQNPSKWQPSSSIATPAVPSFQQNPLPISKPISISMLLKTPLLSDAWTFEQKKAIIKSPRPQPAIKLLPITLPGISAQRFYNEIPWLCGSAYLGKFSCWPCLLFCYKSASIKSWFVSKSQVLEEEFHQLREAHEVSLAHRAAEKKLNIWLQSMNAAPPANSNNEPVVRNFSRIERVHENRKLLSLLVQSVCYLRKERHDAQVEDYAECFCCIALSNRELRETLREFQGESSMESATDFVLNHADPVEDAVGKFLRSTISDEMKNARFITLFMEDLSSIVEKSSVAVIAHFVDQYGGIQERIIGLNEIAYDRSAGAIFTLFQNIIFKFGLRLKVTGFTYSATLVHPSEITAFNERVERLCPVAKCFHYQRHNVMGMLFGALSHLNKSCRNFFVTITEFQNFFKEISNRFHYFEQYNSGSKLSQSKYDFDDYGFITTLKRCYSSVLQTFGTILASPEECPKGISSQGSIFMSFLQDINTRFMITLISQLNLATADVSEALQGKVDTAEWTLLIRRAIAILINIKNHGFEDIYLTALSPILVKTHVQTSNVPKDLVTIFNEIIETAISFLHRRFDIVDFGYVDLTTIAESYYTRLHLSFEDIDNFRSQIVQYLAKEPTITEKTLAEAVKYFHDHKLAAVVPEYANFLDFAMTIPSSGSSLHCPAVERILKYQRDRSRKAPKDFIWMEKELLTALSGQRKLSEQVIDILATPQSTKEFPHRDIGGGVSLSTD